MNSKEEDEYQRKILDDLDKQGGVNNIPIEAETQEVEVEKEKPTSLGKTRAAQSMGSMASEPGWKLVKLDNIPSKGMMYPENLEALIRSVKVGEIRHWSIIDEHDPLDVFEKISFVLEACSRFNLRGEIGSFNINDILEIDKYQFLFKIHRISFPNNENKLIARLKHEKCKTVSSIHVTDLNLGGFQYPPELMEWYSPEERCFVVKSEKLNDEWRLYMPTIGASKLINEYKKECRRRGIAEDKAFDKMAPYLIGEWRGKTVDYVFHLRSESNRWHQNKFLFIHKATEKLREISKNKVHGVCDKCKDQMASSIFLGGSFTVKDIFIISTGLRDLI
jgi:hypothetical protein